MIDHAGKTFGAWRVIELAPDTHPAKPRWICVCECGARRSVIAFNLTSERSTCCGCKARGKYVNPGDYGHPLYGTWYNMVKRCEDTKRDGYDLYGGRGIKVCRAWRESFSAFARDMGSKPSPKHSIDRLDVNGNYEPANCRWASPSEQQRNKRNTRMIECNGKVVPLIAAAEAAGVKYTTAVNRAARGRPIDQAGAHKTAKIIDFPLSEADVNFAGSRL